MSREILSRRRFLGGAAVAIALPPFESLLDQMPVKVILNSEAGLLGAAVYAGWER